MSLVRLALLGSLVVGSALLAETPRQPSTPAKPTREQIARWALQLGDNDFEVRERATRQLWEAGPSAEPALQEAAKSDDAETSRRARDLLDKFKWGIYPSTPKAVVETIGRYQEAQGDDKLAVVRDLLEAGPVGCQAMLKIVTAEGAPEIRKAVLNQLALDLPRTLPRLLADKDFATLDNLLAAGMKADNHIGLSNAAAYWLLQGQLDQKIDHYKTLAANKEKTKEVVDLLVLLYRARGDLAAARETARRAEREDLVDALLYEVGDWKEESWPRGVEGSGREIERLGYRAACLRLAGKQKEFEAVLAEIRKLAETVQPPQEDARLLQIAKVLLLNLQPKEALEILGRSEAHTLALVELLAYQHKYSEALALIEKAKTTNGQQLATLELRQAALLGSLGETPKARAIFARYAGQIKPEAALPWAHALIDAEMNAGLPDDAFEHAVQMLMAAGQQGGALPFATLFRLRGQTAQTLWSVLTVLFPLDDARANLKRLRDLMDGKTTRADLVVLIDKAAAAPKDIAPMGGLALAEVALRCRQEGLARQCLAKRDDAEAMLLLGDLLACNKKWDEAARCYFQAWEKERQPLALYLSGKALVRAGQQKEGQRRMELARLLPLGNEASRHNFVVGLSQRGDRNGVLRESELFFRLSQPGSWYTQSALYRIGTVRQGRRPFQSADYLRHYTLDMLGTRYHSRNYPGYALMVKVICWERTAGLLAAGKVNEALALVARCREIDPEDGNLINKAVPALEKLGRRKEADALFEQSIAAQEKVCREYPRHAEARNNIAWTYAGCRRNLDLALKHAQKAVELAPENASYLDTLAEVYFQRGDQRKAIELQKKAIQMEPYIALYRHQLKRIEAGDPKVPLLPQFVIGDPRGGPLPFADDEED